MTKETISIKDYLNKKMIPFKEHGKEVIAKCVFNGCDNDSGLNEAHLYFNVDTGQYDCKKCGEKGNIHTLSKHFGDPAESVYLNSKPARKKQSFDSNLVEQCHDALPQRVRQYLNERGISDAVINDFNLGYGTFYAKNWITIPIKDKDGNYSFFKLRQDPLEGHDKITYPKGAQAQLFDWDTLLKPVDRLVVCEGELDRLLLTTKGVLAVTSTHGAMTFKDEWAESLQRVNSVYVCYDNDKPGREGALRTAKILHGKGIKVFLVNLPEQVGEKGDVTDYFIKLNGSSNDLFEKYAKEYPEKIDASKFSPLTAEELKDILGLTIKYDGDNKLATFLCELSAYSENAQFNISYNAPSSTGKSFIPTEIAKLFPIEDVLEIAYCSPTAFFHDTGEYDKELKGYLVDLSRKILIFLDQPHNELLARLRPLLSHDKKEITLKITDKTQKHGLKTKTVLLRGFPSVIFCTAGLGIDEQEATRFLLLSPEVNQEKIREGITAIIHREADADAYSNALDENPERTLLKERIRAIKLENISEIRIGSEEEIRTRFLSKNAMLKPRHQRDIKRLISIIKTFAILNLWWRERNGSVITASKNDVDEAFKLWEKISVSQELNLPPYIFNLFQEVILAAWKDKNQSNNGLPGMNQQGITRQEVLDKHYRVYGRMLDGNQLRQQILPMLETAGLITQEQDQNDKRKQLVYPAPIFLEKSEGNSETESGVNSNIQENNSDDEEIVPVESIFS